MNMCLAAFDERWWNLLCQKSVEKEGKEFKGFHGMYEGTPGSVVSWLVGKVCLIGNEILMLNLSEIYQQYYCISWKIRVCQPKRFKYQPWRWHPVVASRTWCCASEEKWIRPETVTEPVCGYVLMDFMVLYNIHEALAQNIMICYTGGLQSYLIIWI